MKEKIVRMPETSTVRWCRLPRRKGIPEPRPRREEESGSESTLPAQEEIERGSMNPEAALKLLETWAADESGYDENAWPELRENIEKFRLSPRKRFRETDDRY